MFAGYKVAVLCVGVGEGVNHNCMSFPFMEVRWMQICILYLFLVHGNHWRRGGLSHLSCVIVVGVC